MLNVLSYYPYKIFGSFAKLVLHITVNYIVGIEFYVSCLRLYLAFVTAGLLGILMLVS